MLGCGPKDNLLQNLHFRQAYLPMNTVIAVAVRKEGDAILREYVGSILLK